MGWRWSAIVALALFLAACVNNPQPTSLSPRPELAERDVLQFEYQSKTVAIKSVQFTADSVSGVDWRYPTDPRMAFPVGALSNVKVIRAGEVGGAKVLKGLFLGITGAVVSLILVLHLFCGSCGAS